MAPDLLEFEEEDDIADQKILGKRVNPTITV
jgi:hypothetical protein